MSTRPALSTMKTNNGPVIEEQGMMDIRGLSYFVAQIENLSQWQRYAEDVLGMMVVPAPVADCT